MYSSYMTAAATVSPASATAAVTAYHRVGRDDLSLAIEESLFSVTDDINHVHRALFYKPNTSSSEFSLSPSSSAAAAAAAASSSLLSSSSSVSLFASEIATNVNYTFYNNDALDVNISEAINATETVEWSHFYDFILSWQGICLIIVFCIFIVITIIGNTLVILAVITTRRLKTVTNCFVMSLAVADLLVGIFVMPPAVAVHLIGSWQLGWVLCDIWISLDVLLCTASILSLCAISVDRYLAVTQPLTYSRRRRSKRLALIMILIVWILALAITCPPMLGWYEPGRRDLKECRYNQNEGYVIFSAMGSFFIPMAVMIYVYARISCVVASRHDHMTDISVHNKKFKRYTTADVENELDHDLCELELDSDQKRSVTALGACSNQTITKDLQESNLLSEGENGMTNTGPTLLALQISPNHSRSGCYEMTRASSLKRGSTASSTITTMTSACTGTGTGTTITGSSMENPWTFNTATSTSGGRYQQQQQHSSKHMRSYSVRHHHQGIANYPGSHLLTPTSPNPQQADTATATALATSSSITILRQPTQRSTAATGTGIVHHHHHHTKSLSNRISSLKKENKTTQTLSIVVGGFIACWLPFFIYYLITPFLEEHQVSQTLAKILTWLGWFNSAINPFIYAFYSVDFRAAFWRLTCKRFFSASTTKPQFSANTISIRR
ncbi:octopamine receptor isoform X2 [Glossina fuscipes]|uniref:Octopamine receptor isoform X2 n=1 Tax=Glossina fuscipes TaxID=7396 RepID=A0A9C6DW56_9MUSC|nr:octopamine receptor isoform X2 [Glossina fuscipes]